MSENSLVWNFIGKDKISNVAEGVGTKLGSVGKGIGLAFGGAAVAGVALLSAKLVQGVKDAASYQTISNQTAAVIKSTGNAARVSVAGLQAMAGSLESMSGVDEELILHGENVLLTFTNIRNSAGKGNDVFNQATAAALNLSTALGTDMQSASIQVGKALNDPIKGVTALQRVGVSFTAQQKEQIAAMVKSGDTMGAQKLILGELNKEFGGAAKAAGQGFAGSMARVKDAVDDAFRAVGQRLLPYITQLANWLADVAIPNVVAFANAVGPKLVPYLQAFGRGIQAVWGFLANDLIPTIRQAIQNVLPVLQVAFNNVSSTIDENRTSLIQLGGYLRNIWNFLKTYVIPLVAYQWATSWVIVTGVIRVLAYVILQVVIPIIAKLIGNIKDAIIWVRNFINAGREFSIGFARAIAGGINAAIAEFQKLIRTITGLFSRARAWLAQAGRDVLYGFLDGLKAVWGQVTGWVSGIANWIREHKGPISLDRRLLVPAGKAIMQGFFHGLQSGAGAAWSFVSRVGGKTKEALATAMGWTKDFGWGVAGALGFQPGQAVSIKGLPGSVSRWASVAASALQAAGAPLSWLPSLLARMQRESGGNPRAINLWDINARNGDPSRGLMQTIGSTFRAYAGPFWTRGIYDPFANIYAAIKYTISRYGSGPAGWNRGGGYDQGGYVMPGWTPVYNGTGKPEHMFTDRNLDDIASRMGGGGPTIVFQHSGPLIGNDVDQWMVSKLDQLKRQRRIS